jgi:two-component system chemotaxis response regulator CheB
MTTVIKKIKVLVVDDSALVRQIMTELLASDPDIEVVGTANDPFIARDKIKQLNPDVLTLDVEMPKMDGITFLKNLMRLRPMPVVMVSTLTEKGADVTLQALEFGAVDYVAKPKVDLQSQIESFKDEIITKVKTAASANVRRLDVTAGTKPSVVKTLRSFSTTHKIIAVGSSTGGPEAIKELLMRMPADAPAMVIAQHIPEAFSAPFARRMDGCSQMSVCEAGDGMQILPGHVYIAPGDSHLRVVRDGARYVCELGRDEPINRHRPSVEALFDSVTENVGKNAVGVMLTGMGADGAEAMKRLHDAGAYTIAQDAKSSVVWGMPGEAVKRGGVDEQQPLEKIAGRLMEILARG